MSIQISSYQALQKLDLDRNRQITAAELKSVDRNNNGRISKAEAQQAGFDSQDLAEINQRYRGKINTPNAVVFSRQDMRRFAFAAPLTSAFESIDRNGNNKLSSGELGKAIGNPAFTGTTAAAVTAAYKNYDALATLDDSGFLPAVSLGRLSISAWDEGGVSREDIKAFVTAPNGTDAVGDIQSRFSMTTWSAQAVNTTLFPKGIESIRPDNMEQGELGDCYFLAAVGSLAATERGKQMIMNMIKELPNGQYEVTFPGDKPLVIHAPTESERSMYTNVGQDGFWLSVLEKAYAAKRNGFPIPRSNPYDAIGGGGLLHQGIGAITGEWTDTDIVPVTPDYVLRHKLTRATQNQWAMSAGIMKNINPWSDQRTENGLPMAHAYSILKFNPETDMITIRNPWGSTEVVDENGRTRDGRNDGTFEMSVAEFKKTFHMVTFEEPLT